MRLPHFKDSWTWFSVASSEQAAWCTLDIIAIGKTFEEHLNNLDLVFSRIMEAGLKIKPEKHSFWKKKSATKATLFPRLVLQLTPEKTAKVEQWPIPASVKEVQLFFKTGQLLPSVYIAKPLHKLTEHTTSFTWTSECQQSFELLGNLLSSPPVLSYPNFKLAFLQDTVACRWV